ncbi:MAG: HlyD family efflux transporter periplasmic adaptor subunit [Faecalibacterium sp.]
MPEENRSPRLLSRILAAFASLLVVFLLLAALYVGYQAMQILFPPNTYETATLSTVADTVEAEGVLLFDETYLSASGMLGYLVADGERVSAGTAVAEVYTDASQASLRQQMTQLQNQIDLLQRSQNTSAIQLEPLLKERAASLCSLMEMLDQGEYDRTQEGAQAYLLAQNKLWVVTGEASDFSAQIADLKAQKSAVQAQLGTPAQITAPRTGYFVRAASSGRLNADPEEILTLDAVGLKAYLDSDPELALDDCAGKIVAGFTWYYCGVSSASEGEKLLGTDGKPLKNQVEIRFPGRAENGLKATVMEVSIDQENDLARFVLSCSSVNADILRLNRASAQIVVGTSTGLRVRASAIHYLKEDGSEAEGQGENYIPGVYVKFGNLARFCRIDPVDRDHPLITDGDYVLITPSGTSGSVSQVRLYDEIIVSGQNLYDGKLL